MHQVGDDFNFSNASLVYSQWDTLIAYVNANDFGVKIRYGLPSEYFHYIKKLEKTWEPKTGDFFPYRDEENAYWTGYYTSRPESKLLIREAGRYLQAARNWLGNLIFQGQYENHAIALSALENLMFQVGVTQHHDAVSGTERQHVCDNYADLLNEAVGKVDILLKDIL